MMLLSISLALGSKYFDNAGGQSVIMLFRTVLIIADADRHDLHSPPTIAEIVHLRLQL